MGDCVIDSHNPLIHARVSVRNQCVSALRYAFGMPKLSLWQRIQRVMEAMSWDEADLRREIGLKPQDVWNWKNRNDKIGFEKALAIQTKTLFNARWIMTQEGPERMTALAPDELRLVEAYRARPKEEQKALAVLLGLT